MSTRAAGVATLLLALGLAACASTGPTRVSGRHLDIVFPGDSPVRPVATDEPASAHFAGRYKLSGSFRYDAAAPGREAVVEFVPDRADARRLPYFEDLGPVQRIAFDNPSTFVEDVIPAPELARMARGELAAYAGRVRIEVDGLFASVDCDQPTYAVTFVAVEQFEPAPAPARAPASEHDGC